MKTETVVWLPETIVWSVLGFLTLYYLWSLAWASVLLFELSIDYIRMLRQVSLKLLWVLIQLAKIYDFEVIIYTCSRKLAHMKTYKIWKKKTMKEAVWSNCMFSAETRIKNPVKHIIWSFLSKDKTLPFRCLTGVSIYL